MKNLLLKENADTTRPYEKCLLYGAESLTDAQLLAVIIRTGTREKSCIALAEQVLRLKTGREDILGLMSLTIPELMKIQGIGQVNAIQLKCVGELSKRIATRRAESGLSFHDPGTIADYYMERLRHEEKENLFCMMLDTKFKLLGEEKISTGTVDFAVISVRDLFLAAMRHRAVQIILVHNHPSGDPQPSEADINITRRVREAGEMMGVRLLDHIIIGDRCYVSFRESGLMNQEEEDGLS